MEEKQLYGYFKHYTNVLIPAGRPHYLSFFKPLMAVIHLVVFLISG